MYKKIVIATTLFFAFTVAFAEDSVLPPTLSLGMNNVPVLNQGIFQHTCATFAVTAALDAIYNKGDYVSQLCNLRLGEYLYENDPPSASGWQDTRPELILEQIKMYGVISKAYESQYGCAGGHEYSLLQYPPASPMSIDDFSSHSDMAARNYTWETLDNTNLYSPTDYLTKVKMALKRSHRVVFSMVYFPGLSSHRGGTSATYKMAGDTWALTTKAKQKAEDLTKQLATSSTYITAVRHARHTMIITGYDDNAVSQDEDGASHVGMLILRNSWGSDAGNHGDFYMNYDYFNALAYGAIEIIPLKSS